MNKRIKRNNNSYWGWTKGLGGKIIVVEDEQED